MNIEEKKLSEQAKRVEKIRRVLAENSNNRFAEMVGITPQLSSSIIAGRKGVGRQLAEKILAAFPDLSREWLYTGDGPMLVSSGNVGDNNSGNVATTGGTVITADERLVALLEQSAAQNTALINIISNLTRHDG